MKFKLLKLYLNYIENLTCNWSEAHKLFCDHRSFLRRNKSTLLSLSSSRASTAYPKLSAKDFSLCGFHVEWETLEWLYSNCNWSSTYNRVDRSSKVLTLETDGDSYIDIRKLSQKELHIHWDALEPEVQAAIIKPLKMLISSEPSPRTARTSTSDSDIRAT